MNKQIIIDAVFNADGSLDVEKSKAAAVNAVIAMHERITSDHDSVSVGVTEFLLANPGLKTVPTTALVRALLGMRAAKGEFGTGPDAFQKSEEAYDRLSEVVPSYIKANPDMFHVGKKSGVSIRYVPTEQAKDADGKPLFDDQGEPKQAYRHTDEEWAKITAKRDAAADAAPESTSKGKAA